MNNKCEQAGGWELEKLRHRDKPKFLILYLTYDLDGRYHRMYQSQTSWSVSWSVTGEQTLPVAQVRWPCPGIWRDLFSFHSRVLTTKWEGVPSPPPLCFYYGENVKHEIYLLNKILGAQCGVVSYRHDVVQQAVQSRT